MHQLDRLRRKLQARQAGPADQVHGAQTLAGGEVERQKPTLALRGAGGLAQQLRDAPDLLVAAAFLLVQCEVQALGEALAQTAGIRGPFDFT